MTWEARPADLADVDRVLRGNVTERDARGDIAVAVRSGVPEAAREAAAEAFGRLDELLPPSLSRRAAAGEPDLDRLRERFPRAADLVRVSPTSCRIRRDDGHLMRQTVSNPVRSYIAGWRWDRFRAEPAPGLVSSRLPERVEAALPFFEAVDRVYAGEFPEAYRVQRAAARETIGRTAFTTAAVNIDYASHYHRDAGDLPGVFSTVSPIAVGGSYSGGILVFPELRVAVDLEPGEVCFFRAYALTHGNTPVRGPGRRLSIVSYARRQLCRTGSSVLGRRLLTANDGREP